MFICKKTTSKLTHVDYNYEHLNVKNDEDRMQKYKADKSCHAARPYMAYDFNLTIIAKVYNLLHDNLHGHTTLYAAKTHYFLGLFGL